jgi:hypothetical protein
MTLKGHEGHAWSKVIETHGMDKSIPYRAEIFVGFALKKPLR